MTTRRNFLTTTATTAAALALASRSRAGDTPQSNSTGAVTSSGPTLRWGIIGTGTRGNHTHITVQKKAPDSQLLAICDVSQSQLQDAISNHGKPLATCTDYQKLLSNPDINAVVIAAPNLFHKEMFLAAVQSGKHVLCEKPFGATPDDARAMYKAAESAKQVVMFGMQYRNHPKHQKIADLISSGRIGKPRFIIQNCSRGDWNLNPNVWKFADPKLANGEPRNWRFSHTATGGTLNEFSCHYFDLLHWWAGANPNRATADGGISVYKDGRDTWDHASVTLHYPNDVTAVHTLSLLGAGKNDLVIFGEEGSIQNDDKALLVSNQPHKGRQVGVKTQEIKPDPEPKGDNATLTLYKDFLECVKTGKKPDASRDRAAAASRTCWLAELASDRKAEVSWDAVA